MVSGSIAFVLKPPSNFESVYEGQSRTTPIPFVAADTNGNFSALDPLAGDPNVASNLLRFVPVPIGSSALILIPKAFYGTNADKGYLYDFRWRLRSNADADATKTAGGLGIPYSMIGLPGAPSTPSPTARRTLPVFTSEQVTPAATGNESLPLISVGNPATLSQGVYDPTTLNNSAAEALGVTYYPPYLRSIVGNELSIEASFESGNWAFGNTDPTNGDAGFSNVYGTNIAGPTHPAYPGVGILLVIFDRNTTP
jgi:hypothetical protein